MCKLRIVIVICLFSFSSFSKKIQFISCGHAYGSHHGEHKGLHPPLVKALDNAIDSNTNFMLFAGDFVKGGKKENWEIINNQLSRFKLPVYYAMGNNDVSEQSYEEFKLKFGNSFYHFLSDSVLFLILDSQKEELSISKDQILFLDSILANYKQRIWHVFIFMHEPLWNSSLDYIHVKSNRRSRFTNIYEKSNYWQDLHPILNSYSNIDFTLISGDVGGNEDAIPAFYDKINNVNFISTGMGEVEDENFLITTIEDKHINHKLYYLGSKSNLPLEYYSSENLKEYFKPKVVQYSIAQKIGLRFKSPFFIQGLITGLSLSLVLLFFGKVKRYFLKI